MLFVYIFLSTEQILFFYSLSVLSLQEQRFIFLHFFWEINLDWSTERIKNEKKDIYSVSKVFNIDTVKKCSLKAKSY